MFNVTILDILEPVTAHVPTVNVIPAVSHIAGEPVEEFDIVPLKVLESLNCTARLDAKEPIVKFP